jgi:ubiquitin-conjugating enzyme E2 Q
MEEAFRAWLRAAGDPLPPVELLRVEADTGAAVLAFSRPGGGARVATVCLAPLEDASFFAEGLEDPSDEVEEWLTDVNTFLSERPKLQIGEALTSLISRAPRRLGLTTRGDDAEEEAAMDDDDDADSLLEREDEDIAIDDVVEEAEERQAKRAAYSEDQQWQSMVSTTASQGSKQASQVLMRELRNLMKLTGEGAGKALEIATVNDSLYHWTVLMHADSFPDECSLKEELRRFGTQHASGVAAVLFDVVFPSDYPMKPPFIRVVRPRFQMHTGHVTIGGSVCMQLLTTSGWLPSVSLENVFVSIRSEMIEGGGKLDLTNRNDYTVAEARDAFNRVAARYGWIKR